MLALITRPTRSFTLPQPSRQALTIAALWLNLLGMAACGGEGGDSTGPGPNRSIGRVRVTTTTRGAGANVEGYRVTLDGARVREIEPSGTATFEEVTTGEHSVELHDIPAGCQVDDNPQDAELVSDETAEVEFVIFCSASSQVGSIQVITLTSRSDESSCGRQLCDPNGYVVTLDGQPLALIGVDEVLTINNIPAGTYELGLGDVAPNCGLFSEPTFRITVEAGVLVERYFVIFCSPPEGSARS